MPRRCQVMLVLLLGCLPLLLGGEPAQTPASSVEVVARFHDGSTIRKAVLQDNVTITTRYGKLTVPVGDIRRIEFGLHLTEEAAQKVETALRNLGSDKFPERDAASRELVSQGFRAFPALQVAAKSKDKEVATRAAAALDKIRATVPDELLKLKNHDVIHTRDCVLSGQIQSPTLKAKTANFGELQFKIADLHSLQCMTRAQAELAVEATAAGPSLAWHDTGLQIESDMDLIVRASGSIEFAKAEVLPGGAAPAVSGPEGSSNVGRSGGYAVGTLLGKIGDKGDPFVIGPRFEAKTTQEGRLYVVVVPWKGGENPTGSYKVSLAMGYDLAPGLKRIEPTTPGPSGGPGSSSFGKKTKGGFKKDPQ